MTKDEALKLALEALEWNWGGEPLPTKELEAMTALRQAIAEAEKQEPYAYIYETNGPFGVHQSLRHKQYNGRYPDKTIPVYTAPPSVNGSG